MPFCTNCGQEVPGGAKYCRNCGAATSEEFLNKEETRKQTYAGEIRKCPNCGEHLSAFEVSCHNCNFEFHNIAASTAVQNLANEISKIEAGRIDYDKDINSKQRLGKEEEISSIDKSIANVIRTFAVPNTKEDILEFMMLAASNIEMELLEDNPNATVDVKSRKLVSDAWVIKFEQTYQKAKMALGKSPDFIEIKEYYEKKEKEIHRSKTKRKRLLFWLILIYAVFLIALFVYYHFSNNNNVQTSDSSISTQETYTLQDGIKETKETVNDAFGEIKDAYGEVADLYKETFAEMFG